MRADDIAQLDELLEPHRDLDLTSGSARPPPRSSCAFRHKP